MQNSSPLPMTDTPPAGVTKVPGAPRTRLPRRTPCCKTCGYPRKGHSRTRCVEVVLDEAARVMIVPCCADSVSGLAGCDCA